jgi:MFS family permease
VTETVQKVSWRTITAVVLVPNLLYATGQGATIPVTPLFALSLNGSLSFAALAAAMLAIGQLLGALPAGWLVGRVGEAKAMVVASVVSCVGGACALTAVHPVMLVIGVLLIGIAAASFQMARHSYMTIAVPLAYRGRAFSVVAGANRLGVLIGPFISTWILAATGQPRIPFAVPIVTAVAIVAVILLYRVEADPVEARRVARDQDGGDLDGVWRTMVKRRGVLVRLGFGATLIGGMRTSRQVIIPLWGASLGMADAEVTLLVGICAAVDFALFYIGGHITDRFGRLWIALPTMIGFAIAHLGLALTVELPDPMRWYVGIALLMAVANGISSALIAAMGADLADVRNPATFLASWRLVSELGPAGIPVLISAVTGAVSLAAASVVVGVLALMGAVTLARYVPRYLPRFPRSSRDPSKAD